MTEEKVQFVQITRYDPQRRLLGSYTQRMKDAGVLLDEVAEAETGTTWEVEILEMTESEYSELPEFTGY